jgi:uncharacterized membrane protein
MSADQVSDQQLRVLAELQRIRLARVMFYFLMIAFVVVLLILLYAIFWSNTGTIEKLGLFGIDGTLGWSFKHVVAHLFPSPNNAETK